MSAVSVTVAGEDDLGDLLPLVRAYCDFYGSAPSDDALMTMSRTFIADPEREGVQLIARDGDGSAVGFASIFWTWSTNAAARVGTMNDLFVSERARGGGVAEALIEACRERCSERGAIRLEWQTALDNHRAQAVYERVGGRREQWLDYSLPAVP
jgi:GNAT superfamily N-acetyltransferase